MFYLSGNYGKYEFISFDRVNNHYILWNQRNATNVLLDSWFGPEWVLTGKLALCLSMWWCGWTRKPIFTSAGAFLWENMYRVFFFWIIKKQHGVLRRQCIFIYVNMDTVVTRWRRNKLCFTGRVDAQVTWCRPHGL